jgi:dephospho-CoA kinase
MISLVQLLKEIQSGPKAIFMAGPAGAGKTFILNKLGIKGFTIINVDEDFETFLKQELGKEDFASMSPEELSVAAKLMGKARTTTREKETQAVTSLQNIVIDGTGAASKPILKKKQELESLGYETFMVLIYVSPMTSLKRNAERGRSLPTTAVLKSWQGLVSNIDTYKQVFEDNIVIINNDPPDYEVDLSFDPERIQKMFPMPQGKPKTPEELEKSKAKKEKTNQEIKTLLNIERMFDDFETAKQKVNKFTNE